jgi:hypothetical protein
VKAGSIRSWASRIASAVSSGIVINAAVAPGGRVADQPEKEKRPKEPRSTVVPANASTGKTASGSGPLQARTTLPGATGRREGTYPRVSGFVCLPARVVHTLSTKVRPIAGARASGDTKMPEGTGRSPDVPDPCKQRSDHRCSRPLQAGPPYDAAAAGVAPRTARIVTTALRCSESAISPPRAGGLAVGQDGQAAGVDLERVTSPDTPTPPWQGARCRSPGPHRARRSPAGPRRPTSCSRPRGRTTRGATRSRRRSGAIPRPGAGHVGSERQADDVPDGLSTRIDMVAV